MLGRGPWGQRPEFPFPYTLGLQCLFMSLISNPRRQRTPSSHPFVLPSPMSWCSLQLLHFLPSPASSPGLPAPSSLSSVEPIFRSSLAACPVQRLHPLFPAQSAGTARGPYKKGHAGQHTPRSCRRPCLPVLVPIYFSQTVLIQNAPCFHDPFVEPAFR